MTHPNSFDYYFFLIIIVNFQDDFILNESWNKKNYNTFMASILLTKYIYKLPNSFKNTNYMGKNKLGKLK